MSQKAEDAGGLAPAKDDNALGRNQLRAEAGWVRLPLPQDSYQFAGRFPKASHRRYSSPVSPAGEPPQGTPPPCPNPCPLSAHPAPFGNPGIPRGKRPRDCTYRLPRGRFPRFQYIPLPPGKQPFPGEEGRTGYRGPGIKGTVLLVVQNRRTVPLFSRAERLSSSGPLNKNYRRFFTTSVNVSAI
ncbi:hypothetical protein SAMN02745168_0219 [Papillibacter cinnamivorans DSM 12816]|uniref:Uncharacterized protein n=1 Tax=Papillibacter cinnamivorans DSM 12816 TaxID=1122930 RepID=A0A1W2CUA1_9FIRM|nr:hypothetical protein SAMN02745168_0219 [Papillibacter cinnamivorans DSM 12816]